MVWNLREFRPLKYLYLQDNWDTGRLPAPLYCDIIIGRRTLNFPVYIAIWKISWAGLSVFYQKLQLLYNLQGVYKETSGMKRINLIFQKKQPLEVFYRKGVLKISQNSQGKQLSHLVNVHVLKRDSKCFSVNFMTFLRALFYRTPLDDCFWFLF